MESGRMSIVGSCGSKHKSQRENETVDSQRKGIRKNQGVINNIQCPGENKYNED